MEWIGGEMAKCQHNVYCGEVGVPNKRAGAHNHLQIGSTYEMSGESLRKVTGRDKSSMSL
jgi:hypothetical protein